MVSLNKKILCFVDEYGTAGQEGFALGCVMVWANRCGKLDKSFSDMLLPTTNEVHSADWRNEVLQGLLGRLAQSDATDGALLLNKRYVAATEEPPLVYAQALIETVKISASRFSRAHRLRAPINNIDVITDKNDHNTHPRFYEEIEKARMNDGRFRAVNSVVGLDSAASRVLQLADVVAYSRGWIDRAEINANGLKNAFRIEVL